MATILDQLVNDTRGLTARRKKKVSPADLEGMPLFDRSTVSLREALKADGLSFLCEIKKASPSKGIIRDNFDVPDLATQYEEGGAAAISVLTEPLHFKGALENLTKARSATGRPLLRKDFIVDPYQLLEAKAYGADAVLLIATVLDAVQLRDLQQAAHDLGLECLVEVYAASELDRIDFDLVNILGVNNRDLRTFEVDVDHSLRVFMHAPENVVRVSESGLRTVDDLVYLRKHNVDAVLIGETFMRAPRPGALLSSLNKKVHEVLSSNEPVS